MDKYEYRVKTEQMLDFVEQRQYDKAMEIADQIDWKRVKNPSMLNTVSEIYEQNGEYKKSRDVLFIAYDRAPSSRKTVYRLGTLALKTGDIEEATDCYEEYVRIAPRDPNQFILKYKILKARHASLTEQIDALERFKQAEYIEKWACELAMLYDEAGMKTECIEECDDLILWFSEGKYVVQAMELKMKYKPLTPLQQEKYFEQKAIIEKEQEAAEALEEAQEAAEKEILSEELSIDLKDNEEAEEKESEETSEEVEEADETAEETEDVHEQEEAAGIEKETTEDVEEKEELIEEAKEEETEQKTAEENEASESVEEASEEISEEEISEVEETIEEDEDSEETEVFAQESAEDIIEKTMAMMMGDMSEVILKDDPKADGKEQKVKSAETRELHPDEELSESDDEDIKETSDSEEAKETGAVDAKAEASSTEDKPEESSEQVEEEDNRKVREETTIRKAVRGETLLEALKNGFAVARGVDIETKSVYKKDEDLRITGQMKIDEILQAWENKQKENAQAIEDQKKLDEEMIAKKRLEAEKRREEEARRIEEQQRAAEEARRLAEEKAAEEAKKEAERRAEEERILAEQKAEEERRRAIEEAERAEKERLERLAAEAKAREEEEARRKAEEEAKRKAEEEARIRAEEEAKRLEEEARIRAEEEAKRLAEEAARKAEEARIRAEIEAKLRAEEEARRAAEEAIRKIEEQARLREEEAKRKAEEEARIRAEEEAKARAEMEARIRAEVMAEMEAKLRAEAEARAKAEAETLALAEEAKRKAEEEAARKAAEEEARKAAEEEARKAAEEEARKAAEEAKKENEESSNVGIAFEEVAFEEDDFDAEYEESLMDNVDFDFDDDESQKDYDSDLEGLEKELLSEEDALEAELAKLSNELSDDYEIEEPSEEEIQKRIKKGKGGMPFDTGFVVTGRYDLSATSEIGLRAGLTEEQKQLFSYFVPVRGMSEQIVEVLDNDRREKRDGTSKVGNILVIGQKGSGKTVLAVDIVKAIQKQRNLKQGKVAIVTGESLNKKELTTIIQKLRGGAIIIEKAGNLNARTVKELNQLMLKKTGELLVVLEDQSQPLEKLFIANPDFKKRFTSSLNLPVFINDELVTFGQTYAKENGYKLDEMGILALYSRIDVMQREDHAVSVAEVKEIMDEAIDHSQKANVKHFARRVFGKGTDESDRVILKEDDFRI